MCALNIAMPVLSHMKPCYSCGERGHVAKLCHMRGSNVIHGRRTVDGHAYRIVDDLSLVEGDILRSAPFQIVNNSP